MQVLERVRVESYTINFSRRELESIVAVIGLASMKELKNGFKLVFDKKPSINEGEFSQLYEELRETLI